MSPRVTAVLSVACLGLGAGLAIALEPAGADIPIYTSTEIEVYTSPTVEPVSSGDAQAAPSPSTTSSPTTTSTPRPARPRIAPLLGRFRLFVPGTAYTTPGPTSDTEIQHTSAGAKGQTLVIRANHTYRWGSKRGRWRKTGDADYPIVLRHGLDGHDWKVGTAPRSAHAAIVVWDGYTWEFGRRSRHG